jgi:hypothetical protein
MFCVLILVFGGTEGVGSLFHVLRAECVGSCFHIFPARTRFRRCRMCRVLFSYFSGPDSFSAVQRTLGPVFMFCPPELIFGGTEGVRSRFHVMRSRTHFWRYLERRVHFSCFSLPDSFSAVPIVLGPVFMFSAPGLVFGDTEGVRSCFHVLRSRTHF